MTKYPGWRTMTAAQRSNARYDRIWEKAKARDPQLFGVEASHSVPPANRSVKEILTEQEAITDLLEQLE